MPGTTPPTSPTPITTISQIVFLASLVDRFGAGKIQIPTVHRGLVWGNDAQLKLLDSIARGFPIGAIVIWTTDERVDTYDHTGPNPIEASPGTEIEYLLDGHQRASILTGVLRMPENPPPTGSDIDWRVYHDLDTGELVRHPGTQLQPQHFPLKSLLNARRFLHACQDVQTQTRNERLAHRRIDAADRLANTFRNYQLPLIRVQAPDAKTARIISARLNTSARITDVTENRGDT